MSFDEWMEDAKTNTGDLEMYGKKKMMGGGRSSKDSGVRKSRTYGKNKATPMSRQEEYDAKLRQATSNQRLGKAMGGVMKTSKPC